MSTYNIFKATYFMPIIHYVHSEKMRQHYLLCLTSYKLTCLNTGIHDQPVPYQRYHCLQPRSFEAMLEESSRHLLH